MTIKGIDPTESIRMADLSDLSLGTAEAGLSLDDGWRVLRSVDLLNGLEARRGQATTPFALFHVGLLLSPLKC